MKKASMSMFYLCIIFLLILSACGPDLVIKLPTAENTAAPEAADPEDAPEEPPEVVEVGLDNLLGVGTAMKWYDDGYLVFVPKGEVTLGDNEYENNPVHNIFLDDFWIYMFKVTNGQYRHCVATGTCTPPASEAPYPDLEDPEIKDEPVIGVTWEQADTYCKWMNGRLPTEAQWEKATRGPQANTYPWGEDVPDCDLLNYGDCENPAISKVYEYPEGRSYYNAFDLAGNTYEWVFDLYEDDFISQLPGEEPAGPPEGTEHSVRGSSYISDEELIPSAQLFYLEPEKYRTDLGFRCVIGESEPSSFAFPCVRNVLVPGNTPPWVPGPPPGDSELPDFPEGDCNVDIGVSHTVYCANQTLQHGGLDLSIAAVGADDLYVKSWSSSQGGVCVDGTDPLGCFGPENTPITFEICATCTPGVSLGSGVFTCDPGYILTDTTPPYCVYHACPPQPGPPCPAGFVYDPVGDICVKVVQISDDCPDGYEYNPDTDCCEATFAPPAEDPTVPSASYLICPPGTGNVTLIGEIVVQNLAVCKYHIAGTEQEHCRTETFNLGDCRVIKKDECKRPGQYPSQGPCEAAGCKWVPGTVALGYCTYP